MKFISKLSALEDGLRRNIEVHSFLEAIRELLDEVDFYSPYTFIRGVNIPVANL